MKLTTSAYQSDRLTLSWGDLWALATGRTLRTGALTISLGQPVPQQLFSTETLAALENNRQLSDRFRIAIKEFERTTVSKACGRGICPTAPAPEQAIHPGKRL